MRLAAAFHLWSHGKWREPTADYLEALKSFDGPLMVGIVGSPEERAEAEDAIDRPHSSVYADTGFEHLTLDAIRGYALTNDGAVLYAHTKGAFCPDRGEVPWRRSMLDLVVRDWEANLKRLEEVEAVGCHWLTPEEFPGPVNVPFFGGNFWMARCEYLRKLPVCSRASRGQCEAWIGRGFPTVVDLFPGWPTY